MSIFEETRNTKWPIKYPSMVTLLNEQRASYWQAHEINLSQDLVDWEKLTENERYFIKRILAFFAASDIIINRNIDDNFTHDVKALEIIALFHFQAAMEDIHTETYTKMLETYITDIAEREYLLNAVDNIEIIAKKKDWAVKWSNTKLPFRKRIVAFSAYEGILFSGAFCAIFWLGERGVMPGLRKANEFISRDEGMHTKTNIEVYKLIEEKNTVEEMHEIIKEAVDLEIEFIVEALPCRLIGMNAGQMIEYIKYVANRLLLMYGCPILYNGVNMPFEFMHRIGLDNKSNFFESKASEYNHSEAVDEGDPYAGL